ncbi:MAG: YbjN domain-containing protein [Bacteroidales bacterium]
MDANYKNFIAYLKANEIRFEDNEAAKLIRFGYNIDMGTIEIVVDFEHEKRIGFFSFLNMNVTEPRKPQALELLNSFNESLNYGSIIISQTNQIVYKIMYTTFDNIVQDEQWAEMIFRLWSISRDIYPLFGRLIFTNEDAHSLFDEFLRSKEKLQGVDHKVTPDNSNECLGSNGNGNVSFWKDFRDWYLQN